MNSPLFQSSLNGAPCQPLTRMTVLFWLEEYSTPDCILKIVETLKYFSNLLLWNCELNTKCEKWFAVFCRTSIWYKWKHYQMYVFFRYIIKFVFILNITFLPSPTQSPAGLLKGKTQHSRILDLSVVISGNLWLRSIISLEF